MLLFLATCNFCDIGNFDFSKKYRKLPIEIFKCCWRKDAKEETIGEKQQRKEPDFERYLKLTSERNPRTAELSSRNNCGFWQDTIVIKKNRQRKSWKVRTTKNCERERRQQFCVSCGHKSINKLCCRQWSKSRQPPLAIQATWRISSRWKTSLQSFQSLETLAERGRERKGTWTQQPLPLLMLHAPSNWQLASQVETDTTVVLHAPNSALRLESELNHYYLPQNFSKCERLHFLLFFKLHKKESIAQN